MGVIYLVRHGQAPAAAYGRPTPDSTADAALTELGDEQARRAGRALAARTPRIDYAVSGALPRQRRTLELALDAYGGAFDRTCAPATDASWDEYDIDAILGGGGLAATMSGPALQTIVDDALDDWMSTPGDGSIETFTGYAQRCTSALDAAVAQAGSGRTVLVASSAGTIARILAHTWGLDGPQWIRLSRTMINASLTKLIVGRGGVSVVSFNEHGHLDTADASGARPWMTFR